MEQMRAGDCQCSLPRESWRPGHGSSPSLLVSLSAEGGEERRVHRVLALMTCSPGAPPTALPTLTPTLRLQALHPFLGQVVLLPCVLLAFHSALLGALVHGHWLLYCLDAADSKMCICSPTSPLGSLLVVSSSFDVP